jgi:tetraacyldisaccharide 4'-kinase
VKARRVWAWPLVPLYAAALAVKDGMRWMGVLRTRRLAWPVVSVGSLSAGGAGKTPVVIALAELLRERGWDVDVLSRGYGRNGRGVDGVDPDAADAARWFGDEPVLLAQRLRVPVWVGAERFAAGRAIERGAAGEREADSSAALRNDKQGTLRNGERKNVHLLDDGFQHRRLARTLDVVLVTEEDLNDALLPAGNRREPLMALRRADVVVLREEEEERVRTRIRALLHEGALIWSIRRQIVFPEVAPVLYSDVPTYGHIAFSAIARPVNFVQMLREAGVGVLEAITFADHHAYTVDDVEKLAETCEMEFGNGFVTTEKDAVKLSPAMRARLEAIGPLVVARLESLFVNEADVVRDLEARIS